MTIAEGNVGVAFGLTFASGAATMLGASVVFFPKLVKLASRRVLAGSLGFSAGVMIYISFVDIFQKSVDAFTLEGMDEARAYGFATLCLFTGVLVMKVSFVIGT
jgi:ZIP family zinc transporter